MQGQDLMEGMMLMLMLMLLLMGKMLMLMLMLMGNMLGSAGSKIWVQFQIGCGHY